ncbi:MAG TPA: SseB family protein [Candidatus Thiothrix moscowensis]|uniref:SseB family protein n=1 Tax=unclassified Thiothrix TaxID=2636184 RepID=UPI001A316CCE|nr:MULTISPECIES: SseB family protein [unclassified Thiothrix]MBJ6611710.1 SseB family protein [Candidatus Thiothrix moscowensis]HRJ54282.1 SseB family protein [Candidatus Thiothrix moscowensis]HRJ94530.1 SseB family protein [Candidatus Thiothrix moscowensis]
MNPLTMNTAEELLLKAQNGELDSEAFIQQLMEVTLFMPIYEKHQIGGLQPTSSDQATPLTLDDDSGQKVLILFTSPERAKAFVRDFPGYGGGLLAEFKWILEKIGVGYNISINPDHELGIDLEVGMLQQVH